MAGALFFGLRGQPAEMGICVVAGALSCAFANLKNFDSFQGAGFAAQLRKRVDDQAITIEQLSRVTARLARPVLGLLIGEGRWGGMGNKKFTIWKELNRDLESIGLDKADIDYANEIYLEFLDSDMASRAMELSLVKEAAKREAFNAARREIYSRISRKFPTGQQIRDLLKKFEVYSEEQEEKILDYEYFRQHRAFRPNGMPSYLSRIDEY